MKTRTVNPNLIVNTEAFLEWASTGIQPMGRIELLEDVRFVATENAKTPNGRRSTNKRVIEHAIAEVTRQYGSEMATAARDYLNATQ